MPHNLDPARNELQPVTGWAATDSRVLEFTVQLADGSGKDIANDTLEYELLNRAYDGRADAVLADGDSGVSITKTDSANGVFEVAVAEGTLAGEWGQFVQRVTVDPPDDSRQSWHGDVTIGADGGA